MEHKLINDDEVERARNAGIETARYCSPDPRFWIDRAGLAGITFILLQPTGFVTHYLEANFLEATFLEAWLHASEGATAAVDWLLRTSNHQSI